MESTTTRDEELTRLRGTVIAFSRAVVRAYNRQGDRDLERALNALAQAIREYDFVRDGIQPTTDGEW